MEENPDFAQEVEAKVRAMLSGNKKGDTESVVENAKNDE